MKRTIQVYAKAMRVNQWVKNFVVFCAILFSGEFFQEGVLIKSVYAFLIYCLLSSTSYILNDIIDYKFDKKHPVKSKRPIASGEISIPQATFLVFILTLVSLIVSLFYSVPFFFLVLSFILLHFFYSLYLKNFPVIDIFAIAASFMIRTFAGEVATGFHIPIWLRLTIFFVSLFMATVKRHAELVATGKATRASLYHYREHLLNFLSTTFATLTIIAYSSYTYELYSGPIQPQHNISAFLPSGFPVFESRKLMMITIPFVVYGIARYAQLLYEHEEGERPEKIITSDKPLIITMLLWGIIVFSLIYAPDFFKGKPLYTPNPSEKEVITVTPTPLP